MCQLGKVLECNIGLTRVDFEPFGHNLIMISRSGDRFNNNRYPSVSVNMEHLSLHHTSCPRLCHLSLDSASSSKLSAHNQFPFNVLDFLMYAICHPWDSSNTCCRQSQELRQFSGREMFYRKQNRLLTDQSSHFISPWSRLQAAQRLFLSAIPCSRELRSLLSPFSIKTFS